MTFTADMLLAWLGQFVWPLLRIGGFVMAAPVFGARFVPVRVRVLLAVGLTLALAPVLPPMPAFTGLGIDLVVLVMEQLLVGVALGFVAQVFFGIFTLAGQLMAMQMGLGFAQMMDPGSGVSVPILSQFYLLLVTLLFLAMNGHLALLDVLAAGFTTVPVTGSVVDGVVAEGVGAMLFGGQAGLGGALGWQVALLGSWLFAGAVLVALPAVVALLLVNIAFGVMTRAAPQLNIFSLGFPFTLVLGLVVVWVVTAGLLPQFDQLSRALFDTVQRLLLLG